MATKIRSLTEVMERLAAADAEFLPVASTAIAVCAVKVQATAKSKFGHYQPAVGPFEEWAELKPETIRRKMAAGATDDDPLIGHYVFDNEKEGAHQQRAGGDLRNSILTEVRGLVGEIGSNDELAPYHEYGTDRGVPPRPFLRPALLENEEFIRETLKAAIATVMLKK